MPFQNTAKRVASRLRPRSTGQYALAAVVCALLITGVSYGAFWLGDNSAQVQSSIATATTGTFKQAFSVTGDEQRLHQVITNLLASARRHTPLGTHVTVTLHAGDPVGIEVHDDGPGVPPELQQTVFERFTGETPRALARTGRRPKRMSLVAAIMQAHGSSAQVEPPR